MINLHTAGRLLPEAGALGTWPIKPVVQDAACYLLRGFWVHAEVHFHDRSRHGSTLHASTACTKIVTFPGSLGLRASLPLRFGVGMLKTL